MVTEAPTSGRKQHWDKAYLGKVVDELSWYQKVPQRSLELIANTGFGHDVALLDVGGGASNLVDHLLDLGYNNLSVLDISTEALSRASARLGRRARSISWINDDITVFEPPRQYRIWHDRAVFHFLTSASDRQCYLKALQKALAPNGQVILATFAPGGPLKCSGLDIVQYDPAKMSLELGPDYVLEEQHMERHVTPAGREQLFQYFRFRRSE